MEQMTVKQKNRLWNMAVWGNWTYHQLLQLQLFQIADVMPHSIYSKACSYIFRTEKGWHKKTREELAIIYLNGRQEPTLECALSHLGDQMKYILTGGYL